MTLEVIDIDDGDSTPLPAVQFTGFQPVVIQGRELPHSLQVEASLISTLFVDPADVMRRCIDKHITAAAFYGSEHQVIFGVVERMYRDGLPIMMETVGAELQRTGQIESAGGWDGFAKIISSTSTTIQASYFIERIRAMALKRELIRAASAIVMDGYDVQTSADDIAARASLLFSSARNGQHSLVARPFSSFTVPAHGDASILIGDRWLCRGDGAILASTSGMGKSSLSLQFAVHMALGRTIFGGMKPNGPLRSLVIQSEDSDGDIGEVMLSIAHRMKLTPEELRMVGERVLIVTDRVHRGERFILELKRLVDAHKPDIVWINPLLAFMDGDINDAEAVGRFLREGLNSLNEPAKFAYIAVHHTAKPPKDSQERRWNEVMYDMAGSHDLTNWARAVISLRPTDIEGRFVLSMAKRGRRAGFTERKPSNLTPGTDYDAIATSVPIRHSTEKMTVNGRDMHVIYWEPDEHQPKPERTAGRKQENTFAQVVQYLPTTPDQARSVMQLFRSVSASILITRGSFFNVMKQAQQDGLLEQVKTQHGFGVYVKQAQAS